MTRAIVRALLAAASTTHPGREWPSWADVVDAGVIRAGAPGRWRESPAGGCAVAGWVLWVAIQVVAKDPFPPEISLSQYGLGEFGWVFTVWAIVLAAARCCCCATRRSRARRAGCSGSGSPAPR